VSDQQAATDAASQSADQPGQGRYDKGPVSITWATKDPHNTSVHVEVEFEGSRVASNTMSPGDTNWDTGRHEAADSWCQASFDLQIPTRGQEGQLELVELVWCQEGSTNKVTNQLLDSWEYAQ
jgi:hypothetical protein